MSTRRNARAGVEDRWHRPARKNELVHYPADAGPGDAIWCMDPKHGQVGSLVCTGRHGHGQRWQARWVAEGQERSKSFAKKADADRHLRCVVADVETGTYADPLRTAVTFGTVAESWLRTKAASNRAPKTIAGYRGLLDVVILPKWQDERLRDITHERLQNWISWLATDPAARKHKKKDNEAVGLSPARVIQTHQVLSQVLSYARRAKYVATNAADDIELPSKPQSKDLALTHDQVHRLAEETAEAELAVRHRADTAPVKISPAALGTMVRFLAYTGLRFGECVALRVGDVDVAKRRVLVEKSITQVRGQGRLEGGTKTHQRRSVPILTTALANELKNVTRDRNAAEFLFPGPDGEAMSVGWFRVRFDRATAALGLTGVTPNTLRHTAGSLAISEVGSVVVASKLLGHRNVSTTVNVYSHMLDGDWEKLSAAMDSAAIKVATAGQSPERF
ncbi:site-specific integrase [Mycolicibacterium austroafricanum]|uniref:Site-specific integrase n=1 Tax=Mycolicibacterium austroafricanum TaxID=39687 RepID=A0ABT8HIC8_MYCAO|nr:site-specific integrase [Mycolicibacterium austroafricanum]MDN4520524.1 site-specific integrase [Mycolicibacterium austroafricanum]QRZ09405.1 site-specific integrase [Mycolicibacterium austroafricanum]QZT71057.1 site-specific integrase [Mycolicibacterium austroafricanum]